MSLCAFSWLTDSDAFAQGNVASKEPAAARFESEIAKFEKWDRKNAFPKDPIIFVGSSSIRLWNTAEAFPELPVINRGFGGSTIADVNYFFDRVVLKYKPRTIVLYCGDNDIAAGKSPRQVLDDFQQFVDTVHDQLPETRILVLAIKPSISRRKLWPKMREVNDLIQRLADDDSKLQYIDTATPMLASSEPPPPSLFLEDGLHLSSAGYELWQAALAPHLKETASPFRQYQSP